MSLNPLTIELAISQIRQELNITYNENTLADDVMAGHLEVCFFYNSCIVELDIPNETSLLEDTLIKLKTLKHFKGYLVVDNHLSSCFEIINNNIASQIFTVRHKDQTYLLAPRDLWAQKGLFESMHRSENIYNYRELIHPKLINRDQLRVTRSSLNNFILANKTCLNPESQEGNIAQMNSDKAIAIMAMMLAEKSHKYKIKDRPNASAISKDIYKIAQEFIDEKDLRGLESFGKRISSALDKFESLIQK